MKPSVKGYHILPPPNPLSCLDLHPDFLCFSSLLELLFSYLSQLNTSSKCLSLLRSLWIMDQHIVELLLSMTSHWLNPMVNFKSTYLNLISIIHHSNIFLMFWRLLSGTLYSFINFSLYHWLLLIFPSSLLYSHHYYNF